MHGTSINSVASSVSFDSLGRITGASNPLGNFTYGYYGTTPRLHTISNDQNGLNTSLSYQTGSTQDFRLTDITNNSTGTTVLSKFDYSYTAVGDIVTKQEQTDSNTPTLWTYGYDKADQLLSATKTDTSTSAVLAQYVYGYDLAGNRTSKQQGLSVVQASFNNLNQTTNATGGGPLQFSGTLNKPGTVTVAGQPATMDSSYQNFSGTVNVSPAASTNVAVVATSVNGYATTNTYQVTAPSGINVSPTYDANGNLTNNGHGQSYSWDAQNELLSITYTSGANSGNHTEFAYDGLGRRIAIVERSGTTIGSGTVNSTKQLVWVGSTLAEERDSSGTTVTKRFYPQGEQIGGTNYYYTFDHLGSVREMTDSSGTNQARDGYDPYGRVTKVSGSLDSDFQFAGYYTHANSGLNLTWYRAYDPNSARWLSRDSIGENGGVNLYRYAANNPIYWIDLFGLDPIVAQGTAKLDDDGAGSSHGDFYHQKTTSLTHPDGTALNADNEDYLVVPLSFRKLGVRAGDTAILTVNGHSVACRVGDFGPDDRGVGEASVSALKRAGLLVSEGDGTKQHGPDVHLTPTSSANIPVTVTITPSGTPAPKP